MARVSTEFLMWAHDTIDRLDSDTHFSFTLDQVFIYNLFLLISLIKVHVSILTKELDVSDAEIRNETLDRRVEYQRVINKLQEYGQDTQYPTFHIYYLIQ